MGFDFLGVHFESLALEHAGRLVPILERHPQPLSGFTFATLAAWNSVFHYGWAQPTPELLLISYQGDSEPNRNLLQPVGPIGRALAGTLIERIADLEYRLRVVGVSPDFIEEEPEFAKAFVVTENRAAANYVYRAQDLATLAGKRFSKKRNLIAQARRLYQWTVEPLRQEHLADCRAIIEEIRRTEQLEVCGTLEQELLTLDYTLQHFAQLRQRGTLLRVEGKPVAFSIYETLNPTTAVVHYERALRDYKGLYQIVNQETAKVIFEEGFELINREEDLDDPGLRQAKLSYHPVEIHPSLTLCFREELSHKPLLRPGEPSRPCPP
ncbi:MAG: DUF2156 domain-containing protein [Myxococcales bacterium]|jgi:hypothetical protein